MKAKRASVEGYEPYYGSDKEEEDEKGTSSKDGKTPEGIEKPSETDIDALEAYE